ncbi:putative nuclease HARBI1 [Pecten maximus]|uniref:putative nuclease HARBI1 n=1 Tax=Pecten maximus TaxID=6579 RepID=UPI001458D96F|nr:putative nuclease HARBI1 [Pecten maximus]
MASNAITALVISIIDDLLDLDDEVDDDFNVAMAFTKLRRDSPKVFGFVEDVVPQYCDRDFRRDFRISRNTFERLSVELTPQIEYRERSDGKEGLSVRKQILIYLWYISNQDSMREISRLFGTSPSTVHRCVRRVSEALSNIRHKIIQWPDFEGQTLISEAIEDKVGIPNVIGFIDGTHIRLTKVPSNDTDYVNRKGYPSIVLQLIVDDSLLIRDCYVGWPGSTHDARVYRNSPIYHALQRGHIIEGNNFIIGDGAYPLSRFLMTPFRDCGRLTAAQKHYNRTVSSIRQTVERAIGHIKGRFRRLRDVYCEDIEDVCHLIVSACVLHNVCVLCDDGVADYLDGNMANNIVNNYPPVFPNTTAGINKRNQLVQLLSS